MRIRVDASFPISNPNSLPIPTPFATRMPSFDTALNLKLFRGTKKAKKKKSRKKTHFVNNSISHFEMH